MSVTQQPTACKRQVAVDEGYRQTDWTGLSFEFSGDIQFPADSASGNWHVIFPNGTDATFPAEMRLSEVAKAIGAKQKEDKNR